MRPLIDLPVFMVNFCPFLTFIFSPIKSTVMKKVFALLLLSVFAFSQAQTQNVTLPPASKKALVAEWIGLTKVAIDYHRPGVKGREGKIFGEGGIVPYDGGNPMPWRAGADENTTIYFGDNVTVQGMPLPAGKYGFHIIPAEQEWTLIFSKNNHSWGSYFYNAAEDALRVSVKPETCDHTEWLTYEFVNQTDNSADIRLRWERKQVTFKVETDVHAVTLASIERELQGTNGFSPQTYVSAIQYCLGTGKDFEKALQWSDRSIDPNYAGQKTFQTLSTRSQVLDKLGRAAEAKAAIDEALPLGTMTELHFYGRSLIQAGKPDEAVKIFKLNRERNPNDNFTTIVGLARGYMAIENFKEAANYFRQAAKTAPAGQATFYTDLAKQCDEKVGKKG
jgi:tetratricopeptide (TPR) repeat protein